MNYKCKSCGQYDVIHPDDICEMCTLMQDPYASTSQNSSDLPLTNSNENELNNETGYFPGSRRRKIFLHGAGAADSDISGNDIVLKSDDTDSVQVYSSGQIPTPAASHSLHNSNHKNSTVSNQNTVSATYATKGITKNICANNQQQYFLQKWFRALFTGIPFTINDDITVFQVFPDFSGTARTASGNACDQVIVYGTIKPGMISDNNDVEVYGRRDSSNNIIAKSIVNKASGAMITPQGVLSVTGVWGITVCILAILGALLSRLGGQGIITVIIVLLCLANIKLIFKIIGAIFSFIIFLVFRDKNKRK